MVKGGPKELESQKETLTLSYQKIPQAVAERAVGFFRLVANRQNSEAAVILVLNKHTNQVELVIPDQTGINGAPSKFSPKGYPMDVKYEMPALPPHLTYMGDIHCHVDGSAYASGTDTADEFHRPGIHIVVGHIFDKKQQFYCDAVVDGVRFSVEDLNTVWEGFDQMDTASVPREWLDKVKLEEKKWKYDSSYSYKDTTGYGSYGVNSDLSHVPDIEPDEKDRKKMQAILSKFAMEDVCPLMCTVRQAIFTGTQYISYLQCEKKAQKFIDNWSKMKGHTDEKLIGKE